MTPGTQYSATRRHFLASQAFGLGSLALAWLLERDGAAAAPAKPSLERESFDLLPKRPHHDPQARAMISIFTSGGPSQIELFDPKPELDKRHGQAFDLVKHDSGAMVSRNKKELMAAKWKFAKHGQAGIEISELLPHTASIVDEITLIRSMQTFNSSHGQALAAINTGRPLAGRPSLGSWLSYGLGNASQDLPAFVVLTDPDSLPLDRTRNWSNGWLPSLFQGTVVRPREPRILNLDAPSEFAGEPQAATLAYLNEFNRRHLDAHPGEHDLAARIAGYELAARMQVAAKEALDVSRETAAVRRAYGLDRDETREFGTRCLIARRLVERGVRFVQIHNGYQQWDHHADLHARLPEMCLKTDQPSAALVRDLKERGLLDTTLVHWGGEMGRLPIIEVNELGRAVGRDHNPYGFSMWLAGGGVKAGHVHGKTDDFAYLAVEDPVTHFDYHATLLHLFGLDHRRLAWKRGAAEASLTDGQQARIVEDILRRPSRDQA